jgi:hypothetical protein
MYRAMGFAHATVAQHLERLATRLGREEHGQGTVEYIGLVLLLAAVMAVVVTSGNGKSIGDKVIHQVSQAIDSVGK